MGRIEGDCFAGDAGGGAGEGRLRFYDAGGDRGAVVALGRWGWSRCGEVVALGFGIC